MLARSLPAAVEPFARKLVTPSDSRRRVQACLKRTHRIAGQNRAADLSLRLTTPFTPESWCRRVFSTRPGRGPCAGHASAIGAAGAAEPFPNRLVTRSDKPIGSMKARRGKRAPWPTRLGARPPLSLGVTTSSAADEAEQLQACSRCQPAWPALQRSHIQVSRLVRRDRHDELVVLAIEFDVDALVRVRTARQWRGRAGGTALRR